MDPIFIYSNNLQFQDNKSFTIDFSDNDRLDGILFKKNKDYYLTSMSCFIEITNDLSELEHYIEIIDISKLSNNILKNRVDHLYDKKKFEVFINGESKTELEAEKSNRAISVEIVEFFDHVTKQKRYDFVYSPYDELKKFGLKFQNKKSSNVKGYKISLKEEKGKIYFEKEIFFDRTLEQTFEENDRKNIIFFEYRGKIYPIKLKITKAYFEKIKNNNGDKFQKFIFNTIFPTSMTVYRFLFEKAQAYISKRYPIIITEKYFLILGKVTFFLSPELYAKNKSFLKYFTEIGVVDVTQGTLNDFRNYLNDQKYSVSKIYKFKNDFLSFRQTMKEDDFVLPSEFKIDFKLKTTTAAAAAAATDDQIFEKTFKSTFSLLEDKSKIKEVAPTNIEDLQGQSGYIKKLSEKVNLKSLTHAYENFFLYDLENVIKPIYTTELQQEFSIYGLISFLGETKKNNKLDLIRPTERLNFQFIKDVYKNKLKFELSKVHTKKSFNVVSNKVFNFGMLTTKRKKTIGQKRPFNREIIETIKIFGIQKANIIF